jgi:hypothetical protein
MSKKTTKREVVAIANRLVAISEELTVMGKNCLADIVWCKNTTEAVRQVLALALADGKPHTTRAVVIICERALATLE